MPATGIDLKLAPLVTDLTLSDGAHEWLKGGIAGPEGSITLVVLRIGCAFLLFRQKRTTSVLAD